MTMAWRAAILRMTAIAAPLATGGAALAQAADPAQAQIRELDDGLIAIMKGGAKLGLTGRTARIGPVVDAVFDLPLMTRLSIGSGWASVPPADQTALVAAFRRLTIAQYAGNFDGYAGETFTIAPQVEERSGDKLVRTTLTPAKGTPVRIGYRMRQSGGRWRVIDVYYNGAISQLATRRADFASKFAQGGAKGLIADLDRQSAKAAK